MSRVSTAAPSALGDDTRLLQRGRRQVGEGIPAVERDDELVTWRVSDLEVRAFIAAPLGAGLTTTERNGSIDMAGLIFAAVYDELVQHSAARYLGGHHDMSPLRGGGSRGGLGTAAGQQITDQLGTTSWTRSSAFEVQAIEYGDRDHLAARGIVFPRLHPGWPLAGTRFAHPSTL